MDTYNYEQIVQSPESNKQYILAKLYSACELQKDSLCNFGWNCRKATFSPILLNLNLNFNLNDDFEYVVKYQHFEQHFPVHVTIGQPQFSRYSQKAIDSTIANSAYNCATTAAYASVLVLLVASDWIEWPGRDLSYLLFMYTDKGRWVWIKLRTQLHMRDCKKSLLSFSWKWISPVYPLGLGWFRRSGYHTATLKE